MGDRDMFAEVEYHPLSSPGLLITADCTVALILFNKKMKLFI